jgi:hypothetical protein
MPGERRRKRCTERCTVRLSGTGRGGVRERQEDGNRKQDKGEWHKESNDGCRWIRGQIDGILRGDPWDKYCIVKLRKAVQRR